MQHAAAYPHPRRASTVFFLTCLSLYLFLSLSPKSVFQLTLIRCRLEVICEWMIS